jgi:hypothetical protein
MTETTEIVCVRWPARFDSDDGYFEQPPLAYLVRRGRPRAFVTLVNETVLAALAEPAAGSAGLLAGAWCDDGTDRFVLVERAVPLVTAPSPAELEEECTRLYPGLRLVGWYCCRPGRGLELSSKEAEWHRSAFPHEGQVGLVCDPATRAAGVYSGDAAGEPGRSAGPHGFYLYRPGSRFKEVFPYGEPPPGVADAPGSQAVARPDFVTSDGTSWRYRPPDRTRHHAAPAPVARPHTPTVPAGEPQEARQRRVQAIVDDLRRHLGPGYEISLGPAPDGLELVVRPAPHVPGVLNEGLRSHGLRARIADQDPAREPSLTYAGNRVYPDAAGWDPSWWARYLEQSPGEPLKAHAALIRGMIADLAKHP